MTTCPGFFDAFAGSGAVWLRLVGGPRLQPPIGYMGGKRTLASRILAAAGLVPGQGAERVVLCDAGPWGLAWQALVVPETCRQVAEVLRGWADEDPIKLWNRLADGHPPAALTDHVATFLCLQRGNALSKPVGVRDGRWVTAGYGYTSESARRRGFRERLLVDPMAENLERLAVAPRPLSISVHHRDVFAAAAALPEDLTGWVSYLDPPYVGATGYPAQCPRPGVVRLALDLDRRGSVVLVSEGEAVAELVAAGWPAVQLRGREAGRGTTHRRVRTEWLTANVRLASRGGEQLRLLAGVS